jgi:hypothetical protein
VNRCIKTEYCISDLWPSSSKLSFQRPAKAQCEGALVSAFAS